MSALKLRVIEWQSRINKNRSENRAFSHNLLSLLKIAAELL